jgi:hypothetical protein
MSTGLTWVEIPVSRTHQKIIHPTLNWIRKHEGIEEWNAALQFCCAHTFDYIFSSSWPRIVIPTEGPTKSFHYLRDPHPLDPTDAVIGVANEEIGLDDEGAALAHVAATFILTWPGMAASHDRKVRGLRARLLQLHLKAKAEQAGGAS